MLDALVRSLAQPRPPASRQSPKLEYRPVYRARRGNRSGCRTRSGPAQYPPPCVRRSSSPRTSRRAMCRAPTAPLWVRLGEIGFAEMGVLAFVVPVDLMAARKVKPVQVGAPRAYRASAEPFRLWLRAWVRRAMALTCSTQAARSYPRFSSPPNSARVSSRTCW